MLCKMRYRLISHEDAKLQSAGHSYSTRSLEYSHALPKAIRDYYKLITEWNKLPRDIESSNSLAAFKNAISNIYEHFYHSALTGAISVTLFLERSKMLRIE